MKEIIGRKVEIEILKKAIASNDAEMISVIGRRRVGKTYLVNQVYKKDISYAVTGIQNAPLKEQLTNFSFQLNEYANSKVPTKIPKNWLEAFMLLILFL